MDLEVYLNRIPEAEVFDRAYINEIIEKEYFNDLKEYGKGYSIQNLKYMSQIACEYTIGEISHQLGGQIPWRTITKKNMGFQIYSKTIRRFKRIWKRIFRK